MNKLSVTSRIILGVASLALIATFYLPVWFIFLIAPQYPEGLTMNIWLDKITGEVDIINGLNHYIGMKHISVEMFPEFGYLKTIVIFYILAGLLVAVIGKRKLLTAYLILTVIGGCAALYDFYRWGYDYGHNLDPKAAIQVPGLSYQPPVIGHKTLLNFDAYSYPSSGGWVVIVVSIIFFLVWGMEFYKSRKKGMAVSPVRKNISQAAALMILIFGFTSCQNNPVPFVIGKDICDECKMTIMDPEFGGEIMSTKGKVYRFDDIHCMVTFLKKDKISKAEVDKELVVLIDKDNSFGDASNVSYVASPRWKSPMNGNVAAFGDPEKAKQKAKELGGKVMNWDEIRALF